MVIVNKESARDILRSYGLTVSNEAETETYFAQCTDETNFTPIEIPKGYVFVGTITVNYLGPDAQLMLNTLITRGGSTSQFGVMRFTPIVLDTQKTIGTYQFTNVVFNNIANWFDIAFMDCCGFIVKIA